MTAKELVSSWEVTEGLHFRHNGHDLAVCAQGMPSKGSQGVLPSQREAALGAANLQGAGSSLEISLDLEDLDGGEEDDGDWEDVHHLKTSGSQEQDKADFALSLLSCRQPSACL